MGDAESGIPGNARFKICEDIPARLYNGSKSHIPHFNFYDTY